MNLLVSALLQLDDHFMHAVSRIWNVGRAGIPALEATRDVNACRRNGFV